MNDSYDAHSLVIRDISIIEAANSLIQKEVAKKIFDDIDKIIEEWVSEKDEWMGEFNYHENQTYFHPKSWIDSNAEEELMWFSIGVMEGEDDFYHYLSPLLNAVPVSFGFLVEVNASLITGIKGKSKAKKEWRKFLTSKYSQIPLSENEFLLKEGVLFLPLTIDADALAEYYPNLDNALIPLDEALNKIEKSFSAIDAILEAAKKYQF